ncbi:MAG: DUF456 domain-containing protein [Phycisphaerae bacterium]|nr:DUF456 domain-containing protein [Phycisphaerae bacterium]
MIIVNAFWLGLVFLALPGSWLMIITVISFSLWQKGIFSVYTIIAAVVLAVIGEILEFISGARGAKSAGGGKKAVISAVLGAVLGAIVGTIIIPIPLIGTLAGTTIGAGLAVLLVEKTGGVVFKKALKSATGAGVGQLLGIIAKFVIGIIIWLIFTITAFV